MSSTAPQLKGLKGLARRLQQRVGMTSSSSSSPSPLALTRTLSPRAPVLGHYRDHIIPLPLSQSISPVPSRLPVQCSYGSSVDPLLMPGPSCLRVDLSAPLPPLDSVPRATNTPATSPPSAQLRIVCAYLPRPIIINSASSFPTGSLLLAPVLTPAGVLEALQDVLHTLCVSPTEWLTASADKRARVRAASARRHGEWGGRVLWIDWLEDYCIFSGLTRDPTASRRGLSPGEEDVTTWVLLVDRRR